MATSARICGGMGRYRCCLDDVQIGLVLYGYAFPLALLRLIRRQYHQHVARTQPPSTTTTGVASDASAHSAMAAALYGPYVLTQQQMRDQQRLRQQQKGLNVRVGTTNHTSLVERAEHLKEQNVEQEQCGGQYRRQQQ